jgi:hypothetical protein
MPVRRLLAVLLIALCGCSGDKPKVPVYGRVAVRGCPVRGGVIAFTPDRERGCRGDTIRAQLSRDGQFQIASGGLPPGWYRVTLASLDVPLAVRYRDPDLAGLFREVLAGRENHLVIELEDGKKISWRDGFAALLMLLLMGGLIYWKVYASDDKSGPSPALTAVTSTPTGPTVDQVVPPPPPPPSPGYRCLQTAWPVLGSKAATRLGKVMINSSWPSTVMTMGVLHEPIHSAFSCPGFFSPESPPGSFFCQTVSPVLLFTAIRKVRSPGPKLSTHRSPCNMGDAALPQMCACLLRP